MANNEIELFQSFCRRYFNKVVRKHFKDVTSNDKDSLSNAVPRQLIKNICLHEDKDPIMLTIGRLLIWWVEAKGLFNDVIYGIPSTDFEIKYNYYPQVKLHFQEGRYESSTNNRRPIRSEVSFRWRTEDYTTANINALATKIHNDFAKPVFNYDKGRQCFTYWDDQKGYRFTVYAQSELEARKVIEQTIRIQDDTEPDWDKNLRYHETKENFGVQGTVKVMGETIRKPKRRPIGTVKYNYAELFIPGMTKPIILSDITSLKPQALRYG